MNSRGERAAEDEFVRSFGPGVRVLVRRHSGAGRAQVEDLAQDVLSQLLVQLRASALEDPDALPAYVRQAVVFAVAADRRKQARRREDDSVDIPKRRDGRVEKKARTLVKRVAKAFPGMELTPAFAWASTFAETDDGLPFFGPHPQHGNRVHFAMAYGGNGITYSMIGAGLLRAGIERRAHPLQALFGFERLAC